MGIVLWSVIYQELWAREEKVIAVKWGTSGFEEVEKDRCVGVGTLVYLLRSQPLVVGCRISLFPCGEAERKVAPSTIALLPNEEIRESRLRSLQGGKRFLRNLGHRLVVLPTHDAISRDLSFSFKAALRGRQGQPRGRASSLPCYQHLPDVLSGPQAKGACLSEERTGLPVSLEDYFAPAKTCKVCAE